MKAEIPAKGIRKETDDSYSVGCECTDDDHSITIWFDRNKEFGEDVEVVFYVNSFTAKNMKLWARIKMALKLVFYGYTEMQSSIILSKQSAVNFAGLLKNE